MAALAKESQRTSLEGLTRRLSTFTENLAYDDIPMDVVQKAKLIIRDGIGNQIGASGTSAPAASVVKLMKEWSGAPQSTVVGYGAKLPAPVAALCNGMMGHGVELDDAHASGLIKAGSVLIPALFATCELNPAASGRDAIAALVSGYEIAIRIAKAINPGHRRRGYHTTSTVSVLGAAAITAKILGCNGEQIANAIGLAAMQSAGIQAYLDDPCMAKPFGPGKGAFNGVLAGILASRGFTGPKKALESKEGFLNAFTDEVRTSDIANGFGTSFAIMEVGFKPHAACRYAHGPIDLAQQFQKDGVHVDQIKAIDVRMSELAIRQASRLPCTNLNASMGSTQFGVALALLHGSNGLRDYWDGYEDRAVHELANLVSLRAEESFGIGGRQAVVQIELNDGTTLTHREEEPRGEPTSPMSDEQIAKKFMTTAGLVLEDSKVSEIGNRLMALDSEPSAAVIPSLTVVPGGEPKMRQVA